MEKTHTIYQKVLFLSYFIVLGLGRGLLSMSPPVADDVKDESLMCKKMCKKKAHFKNPTMIFIQKITKRRSYVPLFNSIAPEHQRRLKSLDDMDHIACEEDIYPEELMSIPRMPQPVLGKAPISDIRHSASCDSSLAKLEQQRIEKSQVDLHTHLSKIPGLVVRRVMVKPIVKTPEEKLKELFKYLS